MARFDEGNDSQHFISYVTAIDIIGRPNDIPRRPRQIEIWSYQVQEAIQRANQESCYDAGDCPICTLNQPRLDDWSTSSSRPASDFVGELQDLGPFHSLR